ncbi:MAG: hypothetical protein NXH75_10930 [Halobacteriovoraceae bacterium]|nr:hypothetical protein [Halobacteriovoraceae bacterium]
MKLQYLLLLLSLTTPVIAGDIVYRDLHKIDSMEIKSFVLVGEEEIKIRDFDDSVLKSLKIQIPKSTELEELKENLEKQLQRRSGDDVGNGGDHLRQIFYLELKEVAEHFQFPYPKIEELIVVEDLGRPLLRTHYKNENLLLLDKDLISGAIKAKRDLRPLMVEVLFPGHKDYLSLYQNLPVKNGRPLCFFDFSHDMELRTPKDFKGHDKESAEKARSMAMNKCRQNGLKGCFIYSQEQSGFLGKLLHKVVVRGYVINTKVLSSAERKNLACKAAVQCEELTFSAPFGQVSPEEFNEITDLIQNNCR